MRNLITKACAMAILFGGLIAVPLLCVAADASTDSVKLYDGEMLLREMSEGAGAAAETEKPLVEREKTEKGTAIEVPRSISYNTSLIDEGARLFRAGRYREAASAFEAALELYTKDGFEEGEIAVLGNLYLTYTELGEKEKAAKYLEACRKKRRHK